MRGRAGGFFAAPWRCRFLADVSSSGESRQRLPFRGGGGKTDWALARPSRARTYWYMLIVSMRLRLAKKSQICLVAFLVRLLQRNALFSSRWKASRWATRVLTSAPNSWMAEATCESMWNFIICSGWARSVSSTNLGQSSGLQHGQEGRIGVRPRNPRHCG